uniref:DUF1445 domain-containing protein n=1 Tax=Alexandrium monilatum TaxID=311494 RepID=A0A7S4PUE2_9DINO|mmetsp:Transcript_85840/g.255940  ORF Transcript_85840/g.255940 Transcript_85840/m.255940 type:complete len:197 (+) Transcript_85840:196-786(+)
MARGCLDGGAGGRLGPLAGGHAGIPPGLLLHMGGLGLVPRSTDVLAAAQLCPRHLEEGRNVPMFDTSIRLKGAGPFQGNMVVSMRPYRPDAVSRVTEITGAYPAAHGSPVQVGEPSAIGIEDCSAPNYGEAVSLRDGEIPVFWACGVTPQNTLRNAKLPLVITHAPGHMFVADASNEDLRSWEVPGRWSARPGDGS